MGLRAVAPQWRATLKGGEYISWIYAPTEGGGEAKSVHYDDNGPLWEEDYYYSGRQYAAADGDGTSFEMLTLHFDYNTRLCIVHVVTDNKAVKAILDDLPESGVELKQAMVLADSIVKRWGK